MHVFPMGLSLALIFLPRTAHGALGLLLGDPGAAERAFRRNEVPLLAFPHLHGHQLRLPKGVLGLVGHMAFFCSRPLSIRAILDLLAKALYSPYMQVVGPFFPLSALPRWGLSW